MSQQRRILIAGNWKMNGSLKANSELIDGLKKAELGASSPEVLVCVPTAYLAQANDLLKSTKIELGAQDVSAHQAGAYTGEVSSTMLSDFACQYVIVGHSERRAYHHESNELVAQKALQSLRANIFPIVCVGETLEQREAGKTSDVVVSQLRAVMDVLDDGALARIVVAYEPVWAIGTGKTATPDMAQEVHAVLRATLAERSEFAAARVRILYGGSMKPENAKDLLSMPDIDGGLIGGASLKASDFLAIVAAA
ncbi:triose-phosphate isomerase [Undibacterium cyanobacteriorum]|uniref:Triosephosphate isomerase n=1 Tax=Undibacterium cyanobacteriorum TaxID=3073561 RepID=A0ABY9RLR5_9BURK|nr:triose-phosphate isomerase [Undibacterium sp. 20NA77.5]WMW82160.1 triose-phosphate isomerase [Undibacterium sp. 20NA77.5]